MEFQIISWESKDMNDRFRGYAFGRTIEGDSVGMEITNFMPYFFVRIPSKFENKSRMIRDTIEQILPVKKTLFVNKRRLFPYTPKTSETFLKLIFTTEQNMNRVSWFFSFMTDDIERERENYTYKKYKNEHREFMSICRHLELYENNFKPILRMMHLQNILPSGWVRVEEDDIFENNQTSCDHNIRCQLISIKSLPDKNEIAPIRILSFDLECLSENAYLTGEQTFPNPRNEKDVIAQIGTSVWEYGRTELSFQKVFTLGETSESKHGYDIVSCDSEEALIIQWSEYMKEIQPDIITGYNIFGFDYSYLNKRAEFLGIEDTLNINLSRMMNDDASFKTMKLQSNAFGDNEFKYVVMPGTSQFDFLPYVRRSFKLESYKLDNVAFHFMKQRKHDVKPMDIFRKLKSGPDDVRTVADYCGQDTALVLDLIRKLKVIPNLIEMSKVTRVPFEYLILRGQQIKVFSQIVYEAMMDNVVIPSNIAKMQKHRNEEEKYTGATVLNAERGCYFNCISGLDFASLYPSIMIAYNMCYSTFVMKTEDVPQITSEDIEVVEWENQRNLFVKNREGLLPRILKRLWKTRKETKRQMNLTTDPEMKSILNGKQLAIKVSMNSVYGFCGASRGMLPCINIAASVTTRGRQMIEHTKNMVEKLYPQSKVVYGDTDSVYVHFRSAKDDMKEVFRISEEAAERISRTFPKPIELEFEKVMFPFVLYTKKRYASLVWTSPDAPDKVDFKGIQIVRRDNCHYVKETLTSVYNCLLYERDIDKCIELAHSCIRELIENGVPIEKLTITKSLKGEYKSTNLPHVVLSKRMKERDPMNYPKPGERVPYVFIINDGTKQFEKVEHPEYVTENNLEIDTEYYLKHQLANPLQDIFNIVLLNDPQKRTFNPYSRIQRELMFIKDYKDSIRMIEENKKNGQSMITSFFCKTNK